MIEGKARNSAVEGSLDHKVDMSMLAILFVGLFSCLIRSDFNFVMVFFCYFVWQQRKDALSLYLIMGTLAALFLFDIIFIFTELTAWTATDAANPLWQTLRPLHNFGIFCFALINILKILLAIFVGKAISETNKAVQMR